MVRCCFSGSWPWPQLLILLVLPYCRTSLVHAHVECEDDSICERLLRPGSVCLRDKGICSNPFVSGCLHQHGIDAGGSKVGTLYNTLRTCNSEDSEDDVGSVCKQSAFNYSEIRILSQNWESAMFNAWLIQIFLSEILHVPSTIELSDPNLNLNFYNLENSFDYSAMGYDYDALKTGYQVKDCRLTDEPCGHYISEVWNGQYRHWKTVEEEGFIENPSGNGAVGYFSWYIPRRLGEEDSSLLEYLGIQGPQNQRKLAETFPTPTNWGDYCSIVSPTNCTVDDGIATRPPNDEGEAVRYHVPGLYIGHFRKLDEQDCDKYPDTCYGHITDLPCDWTTYVRAQAHYLDIHVKSTGDLKVNNGYSYSRAVEVYRAANATNSNVLMYWWRPEAMVEEFLHTEYEMLSVQLPPPSPTCVNARVPPSDRCSENPDLQIGDAIGACDNEPQSLRKIIVRNMEDENDKLIEAMRSPAYALLDDIAISEMESGQILHLWSSRQVDKFNYDPREAVCRWFVENWNQTLSKYTPKTYPRVIKDREEAPVWTAALVVACVVMVMVLATCLAVYRYRNHYVITYAQLNFLWMILFGLFLISVGTMILTTTDASVVTCSLSLWFIAFGNNCSIVPLMVKVAALNRMMSASKSFKRLKVRRHDLYMTVVAVSAVLLVYLAIWTGLDPVRGRDDLELTTQRTVEGETIVMVGHHCASHNRLWALLLLVWQFCLLMGIAVLTFQSRRVQQEFNESQSMGFMIYSRFLFAVLQVILLSTDYSLPPTLLQGYSVLFYGLDTLVTLTIYFLPKLIKVFQKPAKRPSKPAFLSNSFMSDPLSKRAQFRSSGSGSGSGSGSNSNRQQQFKSFVDSSKKLQENDDDSDNSHCSIDMDSSRIKLASIRLEDVIRRHSEVINGSSCEMTKGNDFKPEESSANPHQCTKNKSTEETWETHEGPEAHPNTSQRSDEQTISNV